MLSSDREQHRRPCRLLVLAACGVNQPHIASQTVWHHGRRMFGSGVRRGGCRPPLQCFVAPSLHTLFHARFWVSWRVGRVQSAYKTGRYCCLKTSLAGAKKSAPFCAEAGARATTKCHHLCPNMSKHAESQVVAVSVITEIARGYGENKRRILSPARLPIPPLSQSRCL